MAVSIFIPNVGMGISEAMIVKWNKEIGDTVTAGEALLEIETAKSTVEVEAPASGTLASVLFQADDEVEVGTEIGTIEE